MKLIDQQYLERPFYGSRRMTAFLKNQGYCVNRKRVRRLMAIMGLRAIYRRPRTSQPASGHKVYPYLLRGMEITRPNQVWASDITYIPMARGFLYLVAIMDWYSRYVLAWRLSNTLDADFCIEALEEALEKGAPEIFNTDQGSQFTSQAFTGLLEHHGVRVSMDGKGRYTDNLFIERLWRSLKYEEVYLKAYSGGKEARLGIGSYLNFYNQERPHQSLGYRTPAEVFMSANYEASPVNLIELRKPSPSAEPTLAAGPDLNSAFQLSN
jgi:putative transposase